MLLLSHESLLTTLTRSAVSLPLFRAEEIDLGVESSLPCGPADSMLPRKEVIQPHLPVRLPCYDFTPITDPTLDACLLPREVSPAASGVADFRGVTGGVYKTRERIHRSVLTSGY